MRLFKIARFFFVWVLAAPFVLLYLIGAAFFSGYWRLIRPKFSLIYMSLYQQFIEEKQKFFL